MALDIDLSKYSDKQLVEICSCIHRAMMDRNILLGHQHLAFDRGLKTKEDLERMGLYGLLTEVEQAFNYARQVKRALVAEVENFDTGSRRDWLQTGDRT